uniref:hypothetical protein n=1 Tax=Parerythrobacter lutipelagi TaxID=1964208 RepID=UPI001F02CC37|nr:hypothetical protein [Parerythrobacter lutipelagi]
MKKLALALLPAFALAACGEEPAPAPEQTESAAPAPESTLPAPDQAVFTELFASSCEGAEPVNTAVCRRAMGADEAQCEFGLGEDEYMRHKANITPNDDMTAWVLSDPESICAEHGAHHVDS